MSTKTRPATVETRTLEGAGCREHFLTATPLGSTRALFEEVAAAVAQGGVQPILEKVYGCCCERSSVLKIRRDVYQAHGLDPELPLSYVEGKPPDGEGLAGLQLWGLSPQVPGETLVRSVTLPGGLVGRRCRLEGLRLLYVPAVTGAGSGVSEQARRMFERAGQALAGCGWSVSHLLRTWIYLARLLDWYGEFNRIRTEYYRAQGLRCLDGHPFFPASTGIQGCCAGEECLMDLLAVEEGARIRPIRSTSRQGPALAYGSSFSRGVALELSGRRTVFVSGTASIDYAGQSAHRGDREAQCLATLLNLAALLEEQGGSLRDVCQATLFCKDEATLDAYRRVVRLLGVPAFPTVAALADVCRPDLVVELEAVAVVACQ